MQEKSTKAFTNDLEIGNIIGQWFLFLLRLSFALLFFQYFSKVIQVCFSGGHQQSITYMFNANRGDPFRYEINSFPGRRWLSVKKCFL